MTDVTTAGTTLTLALLALALTLFQRPVPLALSLCVNTVVHVSGLLVSVAGGIPTSEEQKSSPL